MSNPTSIRELRILPPFAIGRLGSADEPLDNYTIEEDPAEPLGFRRIVGAETLIVDERTGEIRETRIPKTLEFKRGRRIRPVAPFLEVFCVTDEEKLEPLTLGLLGRLGLGPGSVAWRVQVANRKVVRRTGDPDNLVAAATEWFSGHEAHCLEGRCKNFVTPESCIEFGRVRYIRPNERYPEIRLRFTPAKGLLYGPKAVKPDGVIDPQRAIYDRTKSWVGYEITPGEIDAQNFAKRNETVPPALFAIEPPAPPWLHDNVAKSRGYLDDACDGFVEVALTLSNGKRLEAFARICAGPPALVPDALFVRSLADDLDQVIHGPTVPDDEPASVTRARAQDIVRRAYETVRFMNVAVLNGNDVDGRPALSLDSMPEEEAADTQRALRPVMSPRSVDTLAIAALHGRVLAALRGGAAPWFLDLLRKPEEVADFTDSGRRKMPALMCGADNGYLALSRRQIDTIRKAAADGSGVEATGEAADPDAGVVGAPPKPGELTPRNLSAQVHYAAAGNPISSRPITSVANCCPGLEVDFRAVWRRMFKGLVLREHDNLIVDVEDEKLSDLRGHRLLRVAGIPMTTTIRGPASSDRQGSIVLTSEFNPHGLAPLEWSNALARCLHEHVGRNVTCDISAEEAWDVHVPFLDDPEEGKNYRSVDLEVRPFFEQATAVIARALAGPGELTQGLCSPWQNDYRECSCYYWASARPDFVNVEPAGTGLSVGDNWLQKKRTGRYVPDDYADARLVDYDSLFREWERWLRFQIGGRDAPGEDLG